MGAKGRTRRAGFRLFFGLLIAALGACTATHTPRSDARPGDFTLGVVVTGDRPDLGAARYIVDADHTLRASFGAGSTLQTDPRHTRTLDHDQLDVLWSAAEPLLDRAGSTPLHPGEPQEHAGTEPGSIIVELRLRDQQRVIVLGPSDQAGAALVDVLESLAWID